MSRLRSQSKHFSRMVISCNPDPDHPLCDIINWYLDEEGYPIPERDGVHRYFIRKGGEFMWGASREELGKKFDIPEERWETTILSFTFVSATIKDNPPMMKSNPEYLAFLEGLNDVDRARLLHGNWYARAKGANYFERDWLKTLDRLPAGSMSSCRAYDLAATERSEVNKNPDATTSIQMFKTRDGDFILYGGYHDKFYDEETEVYGRMLERVGKRDNVMIAQGHKDGSDTVIVLPVDPAAAGKQVYQEMAKKFASEGLRVKKDPTASNKSKLTRFLPFADAAENGLIYIVRSSFDKKTYEWIMKELEAFDGERSTSSRKDDFPDCIASAYNYLCTSRVYTAPAIPDLSAHKSRLSQHRKRIR